VVIPWCSHTKNEFNAINLSFLRNTRSASKPPRGVAYMSADHDGFQISNHVLITFSTTTTHDYLVYNLLINISFTTYLLSIISAPTYSSVLFAIFHLILINISSHSFSSFQYKRVSIHGISMPKRNFREIFLKKKFPRKFRSVILLS
jgi:hypothetical protein